LVYAAVSAAYFAIAAPAVEAISGWLRLTDLTRTSWEYFYLPCLVGFAYTWLAEHDWPDRLWALAGLTPVHRIPSAWDFAFRRARVTFVVVTLNSGAQVAGLYGEGSFASSAKEKRDILISEVYEVDAAGNWEAANPSKSILLCGGDIQAIEFFRS